MADTRLMIPTPQYPGLSMAISEYSHRLVQGVTTFFERLRARRRTREQQRFQRMSRDEQASYLLKAMGYHPNAAGTFERQRDDREHRLADILGK